MNSNITVTFEEEYVRKPVAYLYYTHLILEGQEDRAYIFASNKASHPNPSTVEEHAISFSDFESIGSAEPIYKGDKVEIQF
jgi:hypothetical protein